MSIEENTFSLGDLDGQDYNQEENEQEELYSEDATEIIEESDDEELLEDEEVDSELEEEIEEAEVEEDDDTISYTPFISPLIDEGIIWVNPEKEYDDSPEGLNEIFVDNAHHVIEEVVSKLPEVLQQVFELAQLGEDPMTAFAQLNSFDYSQIDLEDESTQRELAKDYLLDRFPKWSEERLAKELQNKEDLGDLRELAEEAQAHFIEQTAEEKEAYIEQVRQANEEALVRQQEEVAEYKRLIQESTGFAGINFNSNKQKSDFDRYCFEKGEDGLTQYERESKNPQNALTLAWYKFNNFGFETVQKKARSEAYVEQQRVLKRVSDKNAKSNRVGTRQVERPDKKGFSLGDI